ncbi:MAG TPA: PDZ domain-containing protein, partial [Phototrophicaceae bacterium]|nr:PDZ domain-containing protein [Phototrophicaceae bacterium]
LDDQSAKEYNVPQNTGLYIVRVLQDSAAAKAGLQAQDIVTGINGKSITDAASLRDALNGVKAGDTVKLDVLREGQTMQFDLTIEALRRGFNFPFPIIPDTPTQPDNQDNQKSA